MTRSISATAGLLSLAAIALGARQQTAFRTTADAVVVDVTVRRGNVPVTGLTASDFTLRDNGVIQRVETLDAQAMPLDVTVIVDVSANTRSSWTTGSTPAGTVTRVVEDLATIAGILRPEDRFQLIVSDTYAHQVFAMRPPDTSAGIKALSGSDGGLTVPMHGLSSTYDALVAAMLQPVPAGRRHLIVAWTKALDTISVADGNAVLEIARRSDAVVHVVQRDAEMRDGTAIHPDPKIAVNLLEIHTRTWRPFVRNDVTVLDRAARLTGGTFRPFGRVSDPNIADEFRELFDEFRGGYVLRFIPSGVRREGWHTIAVTVPLQSGAEVRARPGYAVEATRAVAMPPNMNAGTAAVKELSAVFDRGEDARLRASLRGMADVRRLIREFLESGNPWPATPKREAMVVLELAAAGMFARDEDARRDARSLLLDHAALVRSPVGPDEFECGWYVAALAILQGAMQAAAAIDRASEWLARCPQERRLHLGHAIAYDQLFSSATARSGVPRTLLEEADTVDEVRRRYVEAGTHSEIATEAQIRAAWLDFRSGRADRALAELNAVADGLPDRELQYFGHLVRAETLRELKRPSEAIRDYRAALVASPGAQSARIGLMTLLVVHGDRREAEALADAVQADPSPTVDPWWLYWQGDYRLFPLMMTRLRELAH